MLILGVHPGYHDAAAALFDDYRMVAAVQLERMTRRKIDGGRIPVEAIDECLAIAGASYKDVDAVTLGRGALPWRYYKHFEGTRLVEGHVRRLLGTEKHKSMERELIRSERNDAEGIFDANRFRVEMGFRADIPVCFFNHHLAHALPTLFHTDWQSAFLYTSDGGGDNVQYSHRHFADGKIETVHGGESSLLDPLRIDSLGLAYGYATQALGFRINRHEGKLTGLAAYGEPSLFEQMNRHFSISETGEISSDFESYPAMRQWMLDLAKEQPRENVAASVQKLLEDVTVESVRRAMAGREVQGLGLCGGVFGNVRLNHALADALPIDEVFIYPAMSDCGLAAGGVLSMLLDRDGLDRWLDQRYPLETLYFGRNYGDDADRTLADDPRLTLVPGDPVEQTVARLVAGEAVALFTEGMEYGPRALGARTILASPVDAGINDRINARLGRTEFMPFAPVVDEAHADRLFDLPKASRYAARFMTITCPVRPEWRDRIPAVVHVDGTARPQVLRREWNPLYFDILDGFHKATGIPALINTSFNAHEEPIINTPAECAEALANDRIDAVVTAGGVYVKKPAPIAD